MSSPDFGSVRRLLVMRLDNIGDVVLTGPALRALAGANPAMHITLMASPAGAQAACLLPWVDDVFIHRASWQDAAGALPLDPEREIALVDELRRRSFDAAVILTSFSQTPWAAAYACYLAGIPVRIGQSKEFGGSVLTHWVRSGPDAVHQAERNLDLLRAVGVPVRDDALELRLPAEAEQAAEALLARAGLADTPFALVVPGASCSARRYPADRFQEVAALLGERYGLPVVFAGSAREQALAPVSPVAGLNLIGQTSVPEFAALVSRASVVVCNNSAAQHLADAFCVPVVVLYSGTDLECQWRPRCSPTRLLRVETPCSPCYAFTCPFEQACLAIPPAHVAQAAAAIASLAPMMAVGQ